MEKSRAERVANPYWTQTDIQKVLDMPYKVAKKVYTDADKIETDELRDYRPYTNRVRQETVLKLLRLKKADIA